MLEIEVKFKVDTHDVIREALRREGGHYVSRAAETNTLLDTPDQQLFKSGCGLRVRVNRMEDTTTNNSSTNVPTILTASTLTYKGPQQPGSMKVREEIETSIGDADATMKLLSILGFEARFIFEKRRETWRLGNATVELDEVPRLGCYVEIEADSESTVKSLLERLDLSNKTPIPATYIALLIEHARANGLPEDRITF